MKTIETIKNLIAQGYTVNEAVSILVEQKSIDPKSAAAIIEDAIESLDSDEKQREREAKSSIPRRYDFVYREALHAMGEDPKSTASLLSVMLKATEGLAKHYGTQQPEQIELLGLNAGNARRDAVEELLKRASEKITKRKK
jgi:hypothetical protein